MELAEQVENHETRIGALESRDAERANEMIAISALADQLKRERDEKEDASAKMVASIQGIFERRQTAQDAQLQKLVSGQNAQLSAQRLQLFGVALGLMAFAFCAYALRLSVEASLGVAAAVWAAVRTALARKKPGGGDDDPPSGGAGAVVAPPLLRGAMNGGAP